MFSLLLMSWSERQCSSPLSENNCSFSSFQGNISRNMVCIQNQWLKFFSSKFIWIYMKLFYVRIIKENRATQRVLVMLHAKRSRMWLAEMKDKHLQFNVNLYQYSTSLNGFCSHYIIHHINWLAFVRWTDKMVMRLLLAVTSKSLSHLSLFGVLG